MMSVKKDGKWGMIDKKGEVTIPLIYDDIQSVVSNGFPIMAGKDGKEGCIDESGNVVIPFQYDRIFAVNKDQPFPAKKDGKWGCINLKGETAVPFVYADMVHFGYYKEPALG